MRGFLVAAVAGLGILLVAGCTHQQPFATDTAVVSSAPGKGVIARTIELSVQVTAIDRPTRTVTLTGPEGKVADVVAGDEVRNFDQIRVGDRVVVRYVEALSLELKKAPAVDRDITATTEATRAAAGSAPAARSRSK